MTDQSLSASLWPGQVAPTFVEGLLKGCLAGEESAYLAVYNLYAETIYRLCMSLLQNREDAEEVMQDTFEYAFRRINHYDANKASFKTWLYQIATSRCRNKRRRKWLPTLPFNDFAHEQLADDKALQPDDLVQLSDEQKAIWQAFNRLSPKLRETAILRYYEGLTYSEIGQILSIPQKTAESRMRLAHKTLTRELRAAKNSIKDGHDGE